MATNQSKTLVLTVIAACLIAALVWLLQRQPICCAIPPDYTASAASRMTLTAVADPIPYDATLYARRRHEEQLLQTGAGPTEYAAFFATETALVATLQGTPFQTTPIPYTADMSPTAIPLPTNTPTASPTLCPPSDVLCPGGNGTLSPVQEIYVLMASAKAPEFNQLARTVTAMSVTSTATPSPTVHDSNCAFNWAHQDQPDIAREVKPLFDQISSAQITLLRVDAYGENCNRADGSLSYFAAMTTDFYLSVPVTAFTDTTTISRVITTAYNIVTTLDIKMPAPRGYLDIVFTTGSESKRFRALISQLKTAIESGTQGADLLEVGGGLY